MTAMILRPWVVVLAAGGSRRFGGPKLLARIDGETLLRRAARAALGCRPGGVLVVIGAHAPRLRRELAGLPLHIVVNRGWRRGLAGSLRMGIAALPRIAPAAIVLLADQPAVGPAELELLIAAARRAPRAMVAARADAAVGPPALFPRRTFRDLLRLRGDGGAKALLEDPDGSVVTIELPAAFRDVDRPSDLAPVGSPRRGIVKQSSS